VSQIGTPLEGTMALASYHTRLCATHALFAILFVLAPPSLQSFAEGFRIETKIFVGDSEEPMSQTTTLFLSGVVYDFIANPAQTAVFRKPSGEKPGQFILLDPPQQIQTRLSTQQLAGAMDKLQSWAARQTDPFLQFAADPKFEESFEPETGQLELAHYLESYRVATSPAEHPQLLAEYREFLDWYTRLNTLLSAGRLPPEPRLRLNEALTRHQVIPVTVELTRAGEKEPLRAEHQFIWRLSREDLDRIDDVRAALASYREVQNAEFLQATQPSETAD
jgi:hypothetical protein